MMTDEARTWNKRYLLTCRQVTLVSLLRHGKIIISIQGPRMPSPKIWTCVQSTLEIHETITCFLKFYYL
jgi:hypothetical protein